MLVIGSIVEAQDVRRVHQFGTIGTDVAAGVVVDKSGNVFVAGQAGGVLPGQGAVEGFFDAVVRKYDSAGTEVWIRQFGSSGSDGAAGVALDEVGNVYVVGTTDSTFSDQVAAGGHDAFIRQYDSIGTEVWTRQFGSSSEDNFSLGDEFVYDVAVDTAGNVYVAVGQMERLLARLLRVGRMPSCANTTALGLKYGPANSVLTGLILLLPLRQMRRATYT